VVTPSGGNFERPLGFGLPLDVEQIGAGLERLHGIGGRGGFEGVLPDEEFDRLPQAFRTIHLDALDQGRFPGRRGRHQQLEALGQRSQGQVDPAQHDPQFPVQPQLPGSRNSLEAGLRYHPLGAQQPQGDGQIVMAAFLAQFGGG